MTVKINTKLTTENITKTPETEFSNSATIPVVDNNEIKNILLSNLNGAGMVPNVITIDTSLLPDGSQDIEGKSYSTFAKAKAYCDTIYEDNPDARFEIHLPAGDFTEKIDAAYYYTIIGHNTVCRNEIDIINDGLIYSVILKNTTINISPFSSVGGRVNFIHCIVDGNLSSADVPVFFYNCIFRGGNLGEKTLTFHSAEIRNTILTGGHITLKNKGGIIFKDCSSRTSKSSYSCFNIWPTRTDGTGVSQIIFLGCNIAAEYNVNYCDPNKYSVFIEQSHYHTSSNVISVEAKNNSNLSIYGVIKKDITIRELTFLDLYSEVIEPGTKINVYPSCVVKNYYGLTLTPVSDPKIVIF